MSDTPADKCMEYSFHISKRLAEMKDELLRSCVTEHIGSCDWDVQAIAHRLTRWQERGSPSEIWALDDNPIVEIWPLENNFKVSNDLESSSIMSWSQNYRKFPPVRKLMA